MGNVLKLIVGVICWTLQLCSKCSQAPYTYFILYKYFFVINICIKHVVCAFLSTAFGFGSTITRSNNSFKRNKRLLLTITGQHIYKVNKYILNIKPKITQIPCLKQHFKLIHCQELPSNSYSPNLGAFSSPLPLWTESLLSRIFKNKHSHTHRM